MNITTVHRTNTRAQALEVMLDSPSGIDSPVAPPNTSPSQRAIIAWRYATEYANARKKVKSQILDEVTAATGWSRDNARRRLTKTAKLPSNDSETPYTRIKGARARKYSRAAQSVLQRVWDYSGGQCGKYLAISMLTYLDALERSNELLYDQYGYNAQVRDELLQMSPATIDRYLGASDRQGSDNTAVLSRRSPARSSTIRLGRSTGQFGIEPGFLDGEILAHYGPDAQGSSLHTLHLNCQHTGWVATRSISDNTHVHVLETLQATFETVDGIPFAVSMLNLSNPSELVNIAVNAWARERGIYFNGVKTNDGCDLASNSCKMTHFVHRYSYWYRYDTDTEQRLLNRLWRLVNDRLNFLTPTKKPIGWNHDEAGRRKRLYDTPATPFDRLLAARVISPAQEAELIAYRDCLNPAEISRGIKRIQQELTASASEKPSARAS